MLQRPENGQVSRPTNVYGFLVGVELEEGVDPASIALKLADATRFVEGVGDSTVDILGQIEVIEEPTTTVTDPDWGPLLVNGEGEC